MNTAHTGPLGQLCLSVFRMTLIGAVMALTTACASQQGDYLLAERASKGQACPTNSVRTCEVIGGNKFRKRYGRCVCARQSYSPVALQ